MRSLRLAFKQDPFVLFSSITIIGLLVIFIGYPVWMTFDLSLTKSDLFSLHWYSYIFEKSWLRRSLWNSVILGCLSASLATIIGFLFAFLVTRTTSRFKKILRLMSTLPIISPPFMMSLSIILLFGKNGFITKGIFGLNDFSIYGLGGLTAVQALGMFPIAYLTLVGVLEGIDSSLEDAALDLGAGRFKTFRDITLPLAVPGLISAWLLVFVTSLADFANPMILAGRFDVLSVQAYLQFTGMGNLPLGAALSNLLLIPCLGAYFLQKYYLKKKSFVTVTGKPQLRERDLTSPPVKAALEFIAIAITALIVLLYVTVLAGCFTKSWGIDFTPSLENFAYVLEIGWSTISSTVVLSVISTPIAGLLGLYIAYLVIRKNFWGRRFLDTAALIPFALPGTAIGIGYVLAFNDEPLLLTGTAAIIVLSFVFRNMPVGIESAKASLLQIDKSIEEAAQDLGADSFRVFREITLPLIKPACFAGMAYVFVHCMTAVSAVIFLVSAEWNHMSALILAQVEILRFSAAAVLCLILILIVISSFWILKKVIGVNPLTKGHKS